MPCARLGWPSRQLLSASIIIVIRGSGLTIIELELELELVSYRIVSYRIVFKNQRFISVKSCLKL